QVLVTMCRRSIAVLDATKWGQIGVASFARPEEIDTIVTDAEAPAALVAEIRAAGIEVLVV
ncbi:MAG: DeoR family transcriptional regulator, partial [Anaerolineae bacterium]|nr:DeoR family transcriptional regulator [Anaerolineae bacterium]